MSNKRMQRWRTAPPKTISVKKFQTIIESLDDFMTGLRTVERSIETKIIANGEQNIQVGVDSWKAYQPFALDKIEHAQFELTLKKDARDSCQLHVEFRQNHIFFSVSDIGTGWIDASFEEMERILKSEGLFTGEISYKLTSTILRLQNFFLVLGAAFMLSPEIKEMNFFYVGLLLAVTGAVPTLSDIYRIFFPQKPIQVLEEKSTLPIVNIEKIATWVGLISGLVALGKEFFMLFFGSGG